MAISLAQAIPAIASTGSGTSLASTAFATNPTVGNYIVAWAWGWTSNSHVTNPAFTDSAGNSWTNYFQSLAADIWIVIGWAKVASTGATFKVTAAAAAANSSINVLQAELVGVLGTSPVDGTPTGTNSTTGIPAPGSMSFTNGSAVITVFSSDQTTYTTFGYATPTSFTRSGFQNDGSANQVGEGCYWLAGTTPTNPAWKTGTVKWAAQQFALLQSPFTSSFKRSGMPNAVRRSAVYRTWPTDWNRHKASDREVQPYSENDLKILLNKDKCHAGRN